VAERRRSVKEMKAKKNIVTWSVLGCLAIATTLVIYTMPPAEWHQIKLGMTKQDVEKVIPRFDQPWGGVKADFKYEKRLGFMWRLAVGYNPTGVDIIEKELFITWPETRRVWHTRIP
jgi:hypothetical protein